MTLFDTLIKTKSQKQKILLEMHTPSPFFCFFFSSCKEGKIKPQKLFRLILDLYIHAHKKNENYKKKPN